MCGKTKLQNSKHVPFKILEYGGRRSVGATCNGRGLVERRDGVVLNYKI